MKKKFIFPFSILFLILSQTQLIYAQQTNTSAHAFESEIIAFEQSDKVSPPAENAILFVGSSSIRMWKSLQNDFSDYRVLNRGFGGSQFSDLLHYLNRIVLPYKPRQIFVYEGDNDINAGVSPTQILDHFKTFVSRVKATLPNTEIMFISIKPSPSRASLFNKMKETNSLIKAYAQETDDVAYVDVFHPMLNEKGNIRSDIFLKDNLHMNAKGYNIWSRVIGPNLD